MLLFAIASLHLATLDRTPAPFIDEAWFASHAWGLLHTGLPLGPLDAGVFDGLPGYWTYFSWLNAAILALPLHLLGLSVYAARLPAFLGGLLLLAAIYTIGRHLGTARVGFVAAVLVALSGAFGISAHLARPDIIIAAVGFGAIALTLTDRARSWSARSVLAGALLGLAFEMHPNAALFGPAVVALYLHEHGWAAWRVKRLWGFVVGAAVPLAAYVAVHILPYPDTFFGIADVVFGSSKTPPLFSPGLWLSSFLDTAGLILVSSLFKAPLAIAACVMLLKERSAPNTRLLLVAATLVFGCFALLSYKPLYYHIVLAPAIDLLVASFLVRFYRSRWSRPRWLFRPTVVAVTALVATSAVFHLASILPIRPSAMDAYRATTEQARSHLAPDAVIMAHDRYWFGLADYRYIGWFQLIYYQRFVPGSTVEDAFRALRPDYLVIDKQVEWHFKEDVEPWAQAQRLDEAQFTSFLANHAQLIAEIPADTTNSDTLRIYRISWDLAQPVPANHDYQRHRAHGVFSFGRLPRHPLTSR